MADVSTALTWLIGGGGSAVIWQGVKWLSDELARHRAERAAAETAPLQQRSLEQRLAAESLQIQQEAMDTLRQERTDLRAERTELQDAVRDRDRQIRDLSRVVARQEVELQRYRPGPGP